MKSSAKSLIVTASIGLVVLGTISWDLRGALEVLYGLFLMLPVWIEETK